MRFPPARAFRPDGVPDWKVDDEVPFQNNRGYAASLGREDGELLPAAKGSPEVLLGMCTSVVTTGRGTRTHTVPLTAARRRSARAAVQRLAANGLRVLVPRLLPQPWGFRGTAPPG